MIRVAVSGAAGKMGRTTVAAVNGAEDMQLSAEIDPALGTTSFADVAGSTDVVVDFSRPDTAIANARAVLAAGMHIVIGTTGWSLAELEDACAGATNGAKAFAAPNFAIGAVLMMRFAALAAPLMQSAEIVEAHNPLKLDAPSGTAARTAQLMTAASGHEVPIHSIRLPGVVADQEVILGDVAQTLTISHRTTERTSFMPGVLLAVRRVATLEQSPTIGLEHFLF